MKKLTLFLLLLGLARTGTAQFVSMPLNYPYDTSAYFSWWTSIVDDHSVWVGTVHQRNHGYVAYSKAVKTTDGGNTWQFRQIPVPGTPWIQHLAAWDTSICYYLFTDGAVYGGQVWKTTDGGTTWSKKTTSQFSGGWANFIHLFSADTCLVMGDPPDGYFEIQLTFDGGNTWTRVPATNIPPALTGETGTSGNYTAAGNSIWFPTSKGRCFRSSDRGLHWAVSEVVPEYINLCFTDEMNGVAYLAGVENSMYQTNDGGASWTHINLDTRFTFGSMSRVPGIPFGYIATSPDTASTDIFFTPDSFTTILEIDSDIHNASFINFKSAATGWLGGSYYPLNNIHKFTGVLTDIKEKSQIDKPISISPNPSDGKLFIRLFSDKLNKVEIEVFTLEGHLVFSGSYANPGTVISLDLQDLPKSFYFVKVKTDQSSVVQKLIIE